MLDAPRSTRPVGQGNVTRLPSGEWQGSCVCCWVGAPHVDQDHADRETALHVATCGLCVLLGRSFMKACSCANCAHRRNIYKYLQGD